MEADKNRGRLVEVWPGYWLNPSLVTSLEISGLTLVVGLGPNYSRTLCFGDEGAVRSAAELLAGGAS